MNREDIIRLADEADLWADQELQCIGEYHPDWHEVRDRRFAALVAAAERERIKAANAPEIERVNAHIKELEQAVAAEREACAQAADAWKTNSVMEARTVASAIAHDIRTRGNRA